MNYTISRQIGSGSFGTVFAAHDERGAGYAAKVVNPCDEVACDLLADQYRFLSALNHHRIVRAIDLDMNAARGATLITELIEGVDLTTYVERAGRESLFALAIAVLDALRHIHSQGRLHGDLKPDGILVGERGGRADVTLVDAGFDFAKGTRLPAIGGTLPYLAPEIIRNRPADGRSDLYSLGVVLYEVLTGLRPFEGATQEEVLEQHLEHEPAPPSTVSPGVDPAWDRFIAKLLRKEPVLRYAGASEAALDLGNLFGRQAAVLEALSPARAILEVAAAGAAGSGGAAVGERDLAAEARRKGVPLLVTGEDALGITRLLESAAVAAKARGEAVWAVALDAGMPALAQILGAVERSAPEYVAEPSSGEAGVDSGVSFAAMLEALEAMRSRSKTGLLAIEGGEVMDAGELEVLSRASRRFAGAVAVLVGCCATQRGRSARGPSEGFGLVEVAALSEHEVEQALRAHFGVNTLPDGLVEEIWRVTSGDRQALEAVVRHLWETGGVRYCWGRDSLDLAWDSTVPLPASLADAVAGRLNLLSPLARDILNLICLSGGRLPVKALSEFHRPVEIGPAVQELVDKGLLGDLDERTSLGLRVDRVRDVILATLSESWAHEAGLRLAPILDAGLASPGDQYAIGLTYLRAGAHEKALGALERAGEYFAAFSPGDAIRAYQRALECDLSPSSRAEVMERIGDVRLARGDLAGALADFEQASSQSLSALRKVGWVQGLSGRVDAALAILGDCELRAGQAGDAAERARVLSDLGYLHTVASRCDEAIRLLRAAKQFFNRAGMGFESGLASHRLGIAELRAGNHKRAFRAWQDALGCFERVGARRHVGICLLPLAASYYKQMDFERAGDLYGQALAIFEETRSLVEKARCCQNYGLMMVNVGDLAYARSLARDALDLHTLLGQSSSLRSARLMLAAIELEAGNAREVSRHLAVEEDGQPLGAYDTSIAKRYLAWAEAIQGNRESALALVGESFELARAAGDADGQRQALLKKSEILMRFDDTEGALELATQALTALGLAGSTLLASVAERVVGEALLALGRADDALERLDAVRAGLEPIAESLHMARTLRALAETYSRASDKGGDDLFRASADICKQREAHYDHALTLFAAGRAANRRGRFIRARRYLAEAGRVFQTLGVNDLRRQVMTEMERALPDDTEITAVTSLSRISQTLNSSHDLATVLDLAMDLAMEYLGAERGVLMLEAGRSGEPATVVQRKMDSESVEEVISVSKSIVESVRATHEAVIASNATVDPRFRDSKSVRVHNVMSVMCVPLMRGESLLGLIYLDNRDVPSDFSRLERAFVDAFANQVALAIENARSVGRLYADVADLKAHAGEKYRFSNIIGPSKPMQEVFRQVEKVAKSSISVLLTGESGTGKELVAGLLHHQSARKDKPMITVNCAAIHKDLLETELFGIEKDVATGIAARSGYFERADGGTLFLDEIGDMQPTTQTKVLRVLAEKELERVGGSRVIKVDVRVISATNQDLKDLITRGLFRKDLYFRLNAMRIHLPALRDRMDDLCVLVDHFIRKYVAENSKQPLVMSGRAYDVLRKHAWPGNVRELEKCIEHAVVVADGPEILPEHLPDEVLESLEGGTPQIFAPGMGESLPSALKRIECDCIVRALHDASWVKTVAAKNLGIHESTLRKKMKVYGITEAAQ
jgi:transcriptional regulator with GAF, ATPase, and Fis domain